MIRDQNRQDIATNPPEHELTNSGLIVLTRDVEDQIC